MNELALSPGREAVVFAGQSAVTMSSREIAELCEKQHKHVMRDIKTMLVQLGESEEGYAQTWTNPQNGQVYPEYRLPKDLTLTLVAGYNVVLRKRIIDRWLEL
ncbi:phage regulatory protein/antirepressor Ant, partial [Escherichia coli]|uniref:Rha family transcriptional regulator n=1 Tax=Escherichia coli TaxID=562 RepID=UPI000D4A3A85